MKTKQQKSSNLLIIFIKNPVIGKVKTRLAKSVGDFTAFKIYLDLLFRTHNAVKGLNCDKAVFYSNFVDNDDLWDNDQFIKSRQFGNNVGERMLHAFQFALNSGYKKVSLVGSDIVGLNKEHCLHAFEILDHKDIVLGPASDGGYYLIGMKKLIPELFQNIHWSTAQVLAQTMSTCQCHDLHYGMTSVLTDLDCLDDLDLLHVTDRSRYKMMIQHSRRKEANQSYLQMH